MTGFLILTLGVLILVALICGALVIIDRSEHWDLRAFGSLLEEIEPGSNVPLAIGTPDDAPLIQPLPQDATKVGRCDDMAGGARRFLYELVDDPDE